MLLKQWGNKNLRKLKKITSLIVTKSKKLKIKRTLILPNVTRHFERAFLDIGMIKKTMNCLKNYYHLEHVTVTGMLEM